PLSPEKILLPQADQVICLGLNAGEILSPKPPHPNTVFLDVPDPVFPLNPARDRSSTDEEQILRLLDDLTAFEWGYDLVSEAFDNLFSRLQTDSYTPAASMQVAMKLLPDAVHVTDTGNF